MYNNFYQLKENLFYDALSKTQEIRHVHSGQKKASISYLLWLLIGFFIFLSLLTTVSLLFYPHHPSSPTISVVTKLPSIPSKTAKRYLLSGIFLSDTHQVAIINHTHYHIGDKVDGMKVIGIGANHVTLQDKNRILTLSMIH